jgi:hypothetical protein
MSRRSGNGNLRAVYHSMKIKNEEWKKLCELVAKEPDPKKLSKHLDTLVRALDARKRTLRGTKQATLRCRSTKSRK